MRLPVLTFDIETMTDLRSGAHLYGLDLPEADLEAALTQLRRMKLCVFQAYGWMTKAR